METINKRKAIIWKYPDLEHGEDKDYYEVNRNDDTGDSEWSWNTSKYPEPSEKELQEWTDAQAHLAPRRVSYPSIGDQLDALYHGGAFPKEMSDKIKAVKDKYPKG